MRIPNPYFENVPCYGDLKMEQIIVDYVYPLLFVLKDKLGNRYLCICFDTRGKQQWIATPISVNDLIDILTNKLTLSKPFEDANSKKIYAVRNYETKIDSFKIVNAFDISPDNIPEKGEYLESEDGEWDEYIQTISADIDAGYIATLKKVFNARIEPKFTIRLPNKSFVRSSNGELIDWKDCEHMNERLGVCYGYV